MSELKLEVFETDKPISPIVFYIYRVNPVEQCLNIQEFMRSSVRKIFLHTGVPIFTDDRWAYAISKLENLNVDDSFRILFEREEELGIQENKRIYSDYAKYLIKERIKQVKYLKYSKYKVGYDSITTPWIFEEKNVVSSDDKAIRLRRKFGFSIEISDEGKLRAWMNVSSEFESKKTVYDLLMTNSCVNGLKVVNDWGCGETGEVVSVGPETIIDPLPNFPASSLKQYMIDRREHRVEACSDDSSVVRVMFRNKKLPYYYYPQALKPVITYEKILSLDPYFSKKISKFTKLDMKSRQAILKEFVSDIGKIAALNDVEFILKYVNAKNIGYCERKIDCPLIICGNNRKLKYNEQSKVFSNGFYKQPNDMVKFAYFYPDGMEDLMRSFAKAMTDFLQKGIIFGNSKFLSPKLMSSELKAACNRGYPLGDPINYKKLVRSLSDENKFDVAIVLVPSEEDETDPYSVFKTAWAEKNIPSQTT